MDDTNTNSMKPKNALNRKEFQEDKDSSAKCDDTDSFQEKQRMHPSECYSMYSNSNSEINNNFGVLGRCHTKTNYLSLSDNIPCSAMSCGNNTKDQQNDNIANKNSFSDYFGCETKNKNCDITLDAFDDSMEDDPYYELEEYLEKVKNEINQVFERYNNSVQSKNGDDANTFQKPKSNDNSHFTKRPKSQKQIKDEYDEWKEWTDRESSSQQYSVSSTKFKDGSRNSNSSIHNPVIYKPEKHVTIPLQSFTIPDEIMTPTESKNEHFFKTDSDYDMAQLPCSEPNIIPSQDICENIDCLDRNMDNLEVLSLCGDNEEVVDIDQECMKSLYFKQRSNSFESTSREDDNVYDIQNLSSSSIRSLNSSKFDMKELCAKSNSAPLLPRSEKKMDYSFIKKPMLRYSRSQSDKYLTEIEAMEACKWLRSAGFPQYAQMFENELFPIKLSNVEDDHINLGSDALKSLYRRLSVLNKAAIIKKDTALKFDIKESVDTEDDEPVALSGKWTFEYESNRWSRLNDSSNTVQQIPDKYENLETIHTNTPVKLRRSGSSRLKDGAKAILKRVESVKLKKRKNRDGMVLSGQEVIKLSEEDSDFYSRLDGFLESKSSDTLDQLGVNEDTVMLRDEAITSHSDSEYQVLRKSFSEENLSTNFNTVDRKSKTYRKVHNNKAKLRKCESDFRGRNYVVRWHSFQQNNPLLQSPNYLYDRISSLEKRKQIFTLSCGEFQMIKKLALVTLTGFMEKYCSILKSGWNWDLPNFIKKIKTPVYKDKSIFGVPLVISLQRTGETIPIPIQAAFFWLKKNALDQVGIFRKSGVKSRIAKLRELIENIEDFYECIKLYNSQQAYDIADMLKQFFRDLPEPLLTSKMSETFTSIFQNIPLECRDDALQCAILLIPDENREMLFSLLEFLEVVSNSSEVNQMNKNNLAVCFAPTIFQNFSNNGQASSSSKKKKSGVGVPDAKELSEAKASHECLTYLISNYKNLYTISKDKMMKCKFGFSEPVALEDLGKELELSNWRAYIYECMTATIKEGKERSRGWVTISSLYTEVEIAYQKVGDGHPLRLWRCVTEVEAPPIEVVDFIKDNRLQWDSSFIDGTVIRVIDDKNDIYYYSIKGVRKTAFTVLRSLHTDLSRGACIIIETSVDEKDSSLFPTDVSKGVVLASRYLIEPCGSGRSKILHFSRVDIKGKSIEWYNKSYGHLCSRFLLKIREHFRNVVDGPESKV